MSTQYKFAVDVEHLTKSYGSVHAVNDLSFQVKPATVFAFLGTNGAGKSTTISCIATIMSYDKGTIRINGQPLGKNDEAIRSQIGVVFQESLLDPLLTVKENLATRAGFYGLPKKELTTRIADLIELIGLDSFLNRPYGKLSGGQKRRVDIARSLIHQPSILFLDEPTTGLDPQSRKQVWSTIHALRERRGITVFLTTHYMAETEEADAVLIIDKGKAVAQGTPTDLRSKHSTSILSIKSRSVVNLKKLCARLGAPVELVNDIAEVSVTSTKQALEIIREHQADLLDFEFRHGTMDDVFLALTAPGGQL